MAGDHEASEPSPRRSVAIPELVEQILSHLLLDCTEDLLALQACTRVCRLFKFYAVRRTLHTVKLGYPVHDADYVEGVGMSCRELYDLLWYGVHPHPHHKYRGSGAESESSSATVRSAIKHLIIHFDPPQDDDQSAHDPELFELLPHILDMLPSLETLELTGILQYPSNREMLELLGVLGYPADDSTIPSSLQRTVRRLGPTLQKICLTDLSFQPAVLTPDSEFDADDSDPQFVRSLLFLRHILHDAEGKKDVVVMDHYGVDIPSQDEILWQMDLYEEEFRHNSSESSKIVLRSLHLDHGDTYDSGMDPYLPFLLSTSGPIRLFDTSSLQSLTIRLEPEWLSVVLEKSSVLRDVMESSKGSLKDFGVIWSGYKSEISSHFGFGITVINRF
jgi:hypothetical protein